MTPFHLCQDEKDKMPEVVATDKELAVRSPGHASQEALEERGVRSYKDRREHINLFESMWVLLLLFVWLSSMNDSPSFSLMNFWMPCAPQDLGEEEFHDAKDSDDDDEEEFYDS